MKRMRTFYDFFMKKHSLKWQLRFIILVTLIIPLLSFTVISLHLANGIVLDRSLTAMTRSCDISSAELSHSLKNMRLTMENIVGSKDIYEISDQPPEYALSRQNWHQRIAALFGYMKKISEVSGIRLYTRQELLYTENRLLISSFDTVETSDWYQDMINRRTNRDFIAPGFIQEDDGSLSSALSYVNILYSPENVRQPDGLLRIDLNKDEIETELSMLCLVPNTIVCLSRGGAPVISIVSEKNGFSPISLSRIPKPEGNLLVSSDFSWYSGSLSDVPGGITHGEYLYTSQDIEEGAFTLSIFVPRAEIFRKQDLLFRTLFVSVFLLSACSFLLSDSIAASIVQRISLLNQQMNHIRDGNLDIELAISGNDEICNLSRNFLLMTDRLQSMMEKNYQYGKAIKNAEFAVLQAQINPHFLYNTLDLINCTAIENNISEISRIVNALVSFYRISLSSGNDIIHISEEIHLIQNYIRIQNFRFEKKTRLICEDEEWMHSFLIPKFTLQPLVENAVIHGILESNQIEGVITLSASLDESDIVLRLTDNGIGMSEEQLASLLKPPAPNNYSSYGIQNISERLALYFGPPFGLEFHSAPGCGTTVIIHIPAISEPVTQLKTGGDPPAR